MQISIPRPAVLLSALSLSALALWTSPTPANAASPNTPVCGRGLYCGGGPMQGASACRQTPSSTTNVYCCPSGQRIIGGRCAAPRSPICGRGLYCSGGPLQGSSACYQREDSPSPVHCCPSGQKFANGKCGGAQPPVCGQGLYCSGGPLQGASPCRQTPSSTRTVYCCPKGQKFANGKCGGDASTPPGGSQGPDRVEQVKQIYRDVLGREADPGGLRAWSGSKMSISEIRSKIARSPEAQNKIHGLYTKWLCRRAEPGGLEHHMKLLGSSMTFAQIDKGISQSQEANNKRAKGWYRGGVCKGPPPKAR